MVLICYLFSKMENGNEILDLMDGWMDGWMDILWICRYLWWMEKSFENKKGILVLVLVRPGVDFRSGFRTVKMRSAHVYFWWWSQNFLGGY